MPDRRPLIVGNWKMNLSRRGATSLAASVAQGGCAFPGVDLGICPAFVHLDAVRQTLGAGDDRAWLGAQDVYFEPNGAFTGEISTEMLSDIGAGFALVGHSERRHVLGESDDLVNRKLLALLEADLSCILCVGETIEQRESGQTDQVNESQTRSGLAGVKPDQIGRLAIAYEPVWAIGTGKTATPQDAQDAHAKIRAVVAGILGPEAASAIRIQYGGSMKPENAVELMAQPDIDGGLIGGASLKADSFLEIVSAAAQ